MKHTLLPVAAILLASCGGDDSATESGGETAAVTTESEATPAAAPAAVETAKELPWGVPIIPGARYISGSTQFSRTTEKRGGEAGATIAYKGSVADILSYYETALPEAGFNIIHNRLLDEATGSIHGENANGEQFRVIATRGGSNAREGESTAAMLAIKPKLAPGQ